MKTSDYRRGKCRADLISSREEDHGGIPVNVALRRDEVAAQVTADELLVRE